RGGHGPRSPGRGAEPPGPPVDHGPLLRVEAPPAGPELQSRRQRRLLEKRACARQAGPDGHARASAPGLGRDRRPVLDPTERLRYLALPRAAQQPRLPAPEDRGSQRPPRNPAHPPPRTPPPHTPG